MRSHVLQEYLAGADATQAVQVLAEIQVHGRRGGPPFDVALVALAMVLTRELLPYNKLQSLYAEAKDAGLDLLLELFFSSKEEKTYVQPKDKQQQREHTLGHRKWQARDTRRDVLTRLMQDPEAEVIPNLLRNPKITERDVVRLAARRPVDPRVLKHIFDSSRWITRYSIKRALVLNPYTPTSTSIRLLGLLTRRDQRLVRGMSNLPGAVQRAAANLLEQAGTGREVTGNAEGPAGSTYEVDRKMEAELEPEESPDPEVTPE